jgi:hypothetical protein
MLGVLAVCPAEGATVIGYWKFDEFNTTSGNHNDPAEDFQVVDSSGNLNPLYSYRNSGYNYTAGTDLPGGALFAGSNSNSVVPDPYGVMFHEVGHSGNAFNLKGASFTLEGYFKTDGDKSGAGRMDVIFNSQDNFSYLVNLNEGTGGQLRFAVGGSPHPQINLGGGAGHNYANGEWHYFVARYDEQGAGNADLLTLNTYDQTGQLLETGQAVAPSGFDIAATSSNLFVGSQFDSNKFLGNVDEIRISRGLVDRKWQLNHLREVAVDTFDNTHDYKAAGVAGTMWDGLLNPGGASVIATNNSPTSAGDGNLEIAIPGGSAVGFDAAFNNAPFLFKNVAGETDFDAQLVLDSTTAGNYSAAGLMVRLADPLADGIAGVANQEDFLSLVYHNFGTVRNTVRNLDDGSQTTNAHYNVDAFERFLRVTREDDLFSLYTRPDKFAEWQLLHTQQRADLAGDVQVGLWHGYFGGGTAGSGQFENFLLMVTPEPSSLLLLAIGVAALLGVRTRRRVGAAG